MLQPRVFAGFLVLVFVRQVGVRPLQPGVRTGVRPVVLAADFLFGGMKFGAQVGLEPVHGGGCKLREGLDLVADVRVVGFEGLGLPQQPEHGLRVAHAQRPFDLLEERPDPFAAHAGFAFLERLFGQVFLVVGFGFLGHDLGHPGLDRFPGLVQRQAPAQNVGGHFGGKPRGFFELLDLAGRFDLLALLLGLLQGPDALEHQPGVAQLDALGLDELDGLLFPLPGVLDLGNLRPGDFFLVLGVHA